MRPIRLAPVYDDRADDQNSSQPRALRLIVTDPVPPLARRRSPRRQHVVAVELERRTADRRRRRPGIDGLLRTVLSDVWR